MILLSLSFSGKVMKFIKLTKEFEFWLYNLFRITKLQKVRLLNFLLVLMERNKWCARLYSDEVNVNFSKKHFTLDKLIKLHTTDYYRTSKYYFLNTSVIIHNFEKQIELFRIENW